MRIRNIFRLSLHKRASFDFDADLDRVFDVDADLDTAFDFDADPDPAFDFDADPNPAFDFDADLDWAFDFDADPYPAFDFDADQYLAFDVDADPDPVFDLNADPDPAFDFDMNLGSVFLKYSGSIRLRIRHTCRLQYFILVWGGGGVSHLITCCVIHGGFMTCLQVRNMLAVRHVTCINHNTRGAHMLFSKSGLFF
jgi:hypothetical protein